MSNSSLHSIASDDSLHPSLAEAAASMPQQPPLPETDPACPCNSIISHADVRRCIKCGGGIRPIARLANDKLILEHQQEILRKKLEAARSREEEATVEMGKLRQRNEKIEEILDLKQYELEQMKRDFEMISDKLIDEIEKRAEIQHSKETIQDDLEELTASLFTEANTMVADRSRQLDEYQKRSESLAKEIELMRLQLQKEQAQAHELRSRVGLLEDQNEKLLIETEQGRQMLRHKPSALNSSLRVHTDEERASAGNVPVEELIDPQQFAHFAEFLQAAPTVKVNKLHALIFMRNALEDDVTPCLRFGGNPRTSTKKFIDAIIAHTCFVEEMSPDEIKELKLRDERAAQHAAERAAAHGQDASSHAPSLHTSPSRTGLSAAYNAAASAAGAAQADKSSTKSSLFNKTVLERLTNALANANLASLGSNDALAAVAAGCSTCGRDEEYRFHFKITDVSDETWYPICLNCRDRLVAACDFYAFVRHVRQGLFSTRRPEDLYMESLRLKRTMFYTRVGAAQYINSEQVFPQIRPLRPNSALINMQLPLNGIAGSGSVQRDRSPLSPPSAHNQSPFVSSANSDVPLAQLQERFRARQQGAAGLSTVGEGPGSGSPATTAGSPMDPASSTLASPNNNIINNNSSSGGSNAYGGATSPNSAISPNMATMMAAAVPVPSTNPSTPVLRTDTPL
ncbi:hypothetical protein BC831DRAFT_452873 [Entophlyctis helioformis]|nr:hypothetical protein BC831DRAFT_452873 [Entophlyctis helioformis]